MNPPTFTEAYRRQITRRWFFKECGVGLGSIALGSLLADRLSGASSLAHPLAPKPPHFAPKAKRVIYLFMAGAPSHLELFDHKPMLAKFSGTLPPPELLKRRFAGEPITTRRRGRSPTHRLGS